MHFYVGMHCIVDGLNNPRTNSDVIVEEIGLHLRQFPSLSALTQFASV